ncbi:ABC-type transport system permease protein (probable substrate iron) [Salinarchaeum sp. Harcht-Bsk1]|uniref:ABC transporter permease n=1 Tax=Salinarchaeum sp. Harcht-Bsk1 TaxID=1333523 RepID=UPI000342348B|nr:iron ABC transporter permease [Salinarchaeum sp. Harcht-Bsk1]AGN01854.1 ABC-type transport system permease protein (probable substrate iron) [Salinarchaeum sp. Harcht-Bsk1]
MSVRERLQVVRQRIGGSGDAGERPPRSLLAISGAIALVVVFPLVWLLVTAAEIDPGEAWDLATSEETLTVLKNSLLLMGGVTAGSVLLGVPLAYLTVRTDLPFRRFWTIVSALPLVIPSYVGAFTVVSAFGPRGRFQDMLEPLGVEQIPEIYGLPGAIVVITLYTYPYVYLTTRAALLSFDARLVEAARTLNHGKLAAFWRVTLPQIRPAIAAGALLAALYAISDFGTPAIMRLPVFTREIYVEFGQLGQAPEAVLSLQLLAIVALVLVIERWIVPDASASESEATRDRPVSLGRWRWVAMGFPALVAGLALLVPLWILYLWLSSSATARRPSLAFEWSMATNSVKVAAAAALIAAIAALPIGYLSAHHDSRLAAVFERGTYLGFAVPGVVLGLSLVYLGTRLVPALYFTLPLLIFGYVVRFLPQAVGSIRSTTLQVDPRLVEAARTLGDSPFRAFRRVTLPQIVPGIVAGAALVFLTTMKELPVTLMLKPNEFETIATQIWRAQDSHFYQYAVVPALLLMVISGFSMIVLLASEGGREGL